MAAEEPVAEVRRAERRFFTGMAVGILVLALAGFARTYFLRPVLAARSSARRAAMAASRRAWSSSSSARRAAATTRLSRAGVDMVWVVVWVVGCPDGAGVPVATTSSAGC